MRALLTGLLLWVFTLAQAQSVQQPNSAPSVNDIEFHRQRREALRKLLPPRSVAVFFASPVRNRANDVDYPYHPDPTLLYLTGFKEPNAVLLVFAEQTEIAGTPCKEVLLVQPRDARRELWTGSILGPERAKEQTGLELTLPNKDFTKLNTAFTTAAQVLIQPLPDDISSESGLYKLYSQFKAMVQLPAQFEPLRYHLYARIAAAGKQQYQSLQAELAKTLQQRPELSDDALLVAYANASSNKEREKVQKQVPVTRVDAIQLPALLSTLREQKEPIELQKLRRAITVSAVGQVEVMKAMKHGLSETEVQGLHEYVYRKYGLAFEGYPSIVGAGNNACVLHYTTNNKPALEQNELILMDCGAEYEGYTADVTRTIPVSGKFSTEQKQIYDIVLAAQDAGIAQCKLGNAFWAPNQAAQKVIAEGLIKLGIIKEEKEARRYFPHGTSHYLGLDVHDAGTYGVFKPNTVITVEPGIYIPENSPCDPKWWRIGIRIEDDILITESGWENLSKLAPRTTAEIEATMALPSPLDNFKLPEVK